jgi:hypothetical protein
MLVPQIYSPRIKSRGFNPSPEAGNIPIWADSRINPKVIGTQAWKDYWDEQIYYCKYGYDTGGLHIPGEYYHFLNYKIIDGAGANKTYPDFIDVHYDLHLHWNEIEQNPKKAGLVVPKARRLGLTFFAVDKIDYGHRFREAYRSCVVGGLETFVQQFKGKLIRIFNNTPNEFYIEPYINDKEEFITGLKDLRNKINAMKRTEPFGYTIFKTMKDEATKLEGEYFDLAVFEEMGEFQLSNSAMTSIGPALKEGEAYKGKFLCLGTGGKMSKGGKTFKETVYAHEYLNLDVHILPGNRMYFPYVIRKNKEVKAPNIYKQYPKLKFEQLLGCEDTVEAQKALREERAQLAKMQNKKKFIEHCQNYPETLEDIFNSSGSNNFNNAKLNIQSFAIDSLPAEKFVAYILEYEKDKDGMELSPRKVIARPANSNDKDWEKVFIYKHPKTHIKNLDVGGTDSYNQDKTNTSKSLGGINVLRRNDIFPDNEETEPGRVPICFYYGRPPRKEQHWEISLKISYLYNLVGNMMISAESDACIDYYKNHGGKKFLAIRPRAFDAPDSELQNEFGAKMTNYSKPRMISLLQSWVEDHIIYCWCKLLINDLLTYDEENIGTDWDLADATGLALMRIVDMKRKPSLKEEVEVKKSEMDMIEWGDDGNGNIVILNSFKEQEELFKQNKEEKKEDKKESENKKIKRTSGMGYIPDNF